MQSYDAIIIGTGQAGPSLAKRLAGAGQRVAIIERKAFGGTCINTGCTPTKTLVASAYAAHMARRAADFGVVVSGGVAVDMRRTAECVAAMPGSLRPARSKSVANGSLPNASSSTSAAGQRCRRSPASTACLT